MKFYPVYFVNKCRSKPNKNKIMKIINKFMNEEIEDSNIEDLYVFFFYEDEI